MLCPSFLHTAPVSSLLPAICPNVSRQASATGSSGVLCRLYAALWRTKAFQDCSLWRSARDPPCRTHQTPSARPRHHPTACCHSWTRVVCWIHHHESLSHHAIAFLRALGGIAARCPLCASLSTSGHQLAMRLAIRARPSVS